MNRYINSKNVHLVLVGEMQGTNDLQVTVNAYKDKREARRGAGLDVPFPEVAP